MLKERKSTRSVLKPSPIPETVGKKVREVGSPLGSDEQGPPRFPGDTTVKAMGGTVSVIEDAVTLPINDQSTASLEVVGTGFTGTVSFEGSISGTRWFAINGYPPTTLTGATSGAATGEWIIPCASLGLVRARLSAVSGGSAALKLRAGPYSFYTPPTGGGGASSAVTIADGADSAMGAKADAAATTDTGTFSLIALTKRLLAKLTTGINVGGFAKKPSCVLTRGANVTPYTIGDEVGTAGTAPTTFVAGRANAGTGFILGATGIYSNYPALIPDLVILVFNGTVTLAGDNAQLNLSDADAAKCVAVLRTVATESGSYSAGVAASAGNLIMSFAPTVSKAFECGASETTLYVACFTKNAFTPIANSETLTLVFDIDRD